MNSGSETGKRFEWKFREPLVPNAGIFQTRLKIIYRWVKREYVFTNAEQMLLRCSVDTCFTMQIYVRAINY